MVVVVRVGIGWGGDRVVVEGRGGGDDGEGQ